MIRADTHTYTQFNAKKVFIYLFIGISFDYFTCKRKQKEDPSLKISRCKVKKKIPTRVNLLESEMKSII